jgi:hypothetical protein
MCIRSCSKRPGNEMENVRCLLGFVSRDSMVCGVVDDVVEDHSELKPYSLGNGLKKEYSTSCEVLAPLL